MGLTSSSTGTKLLNNELEELIEMIKNKKDPFNFAYINAYIMKYFEMLYLKEMPK